MLRFLFFAGLAVLGGVPALAQQGPRFSFKSELSALVALRYAGSAEWFSSPRNGWEIQAGYEQLPTPDLFSGSWTVEYAKAEIRYRNTYDDFFYRTTQPQYVGEGRPLPAAEAYAATSILQFSLAHRFYFLSAQKHWRVILQPAFATVRYHYFDTRHRTEVVGEEIKERVNGFTVESNRTVYYRDIRETYFREKWLNGMAYALGVQYIFKGGFTLEGRILRGINFGRQAAAELRADLPRLRSFYGSGSLWLGYRFG